MAVVSRMRDPRIRVASLCVFVAQLSKEDVVRLLRRDVRHSTSGAAAIMNERGESAVEGRIMVELPESIMRAFEANIRLYERESPWPIPSFHRESSRGPMTASWIVRRITQEAGLQGIDMTCHRIQLAGAADAILHGEAEERVVKRLGGKYWAGELEKALHEKRS